MSVPDVTNLAAPDAVVALRSYPRRFRSAVLPIADDPTVEALAERVGPSGSSALDVVVATTNTWVLLGQALRQVLVEDDPVVHGGVLDAAQRTWDPPPGTTVDGALDRLTDEAAALADAVDAVASRDWSRTGSVAGAGAVSAIDLVREAVRTGSQGVVDAEAAVAAARASS
jgi:hypothetical protein